MWHFSHSLSMIYIQSVHRSLAIFRCLDIILWSYFDLERALNACLSFFIVISSSVQSLPWCKALISWTIHESLVAACWNSSRMARSRHPVSLQSNLLYCHTNLFVLMLYERDVSTVQPSHRMINVNLFSASLGWRSGRRAQFLVLSSLWCFGSGTGFCTKDLWTKSTINSSHWTVHHQFQSLQSQLCLIFDLIGIELAPPS